MKEVTKIMIKRYSKNEDSDFVEIKERKNSKTKSGCRNGIGGEEKIGRGRGKRGKRAEERNRFKRERKKRSHEERKRERGRDVRKGRE